MAAISNIIQILPAESFRCTIWYLFQSLHVQSIRNGYTKMVHQASHYFNFHPVRYLIEGHREQENACNQLPISVNFNQYFQVSTQGFKQKKYRFLLLSLASFETFHLLRFEAEPFFRGGNFFLVRFENSLYKKS